MDIDKAGRVCSYVHAQLPFVPFYGTDLLDPVESIPEAFGLQTPVLTARNPLVTIRSEVQGSRSAPARADPTLIKKSTEVQKKRLMEHPIGIEEWKRQSRLKRHIRTTPDHDPSSEPAKEHAARKRQRRRSREKPSLPTGLSFLYGFSPKNVGPSRLTIPVRAKGVFGKGKSSSTIAGIPLLDLPAQSSFYGGPEFTAAGPQLPSTSSSSGLGCVPLPSGISEPATIKSTGKIAEDVRSQPEQTEGVLDNRSTTWDIELEDGILPSDSSSFAWGTTVVIDTEKIWNHQKGLKQSLQVAVDSCDQPRSLATRTPDEYSRSSPRVASRFFSNCVSSLREDRSVPGTPTPGRGDRSGGEFEVSTWDDYFHYHRTDVGWDGSSCLETDSFSGGYFRTHPSVTGKAHQEMMPDWNDMQSFDTSLIEFANSEDNDSPVSDPSLEASHEALSDLDTPERVHCFFEGRRLLLGV